MLIPCLEASGYTPPLLRIAIAGLEVRPYVNTFEDQSIYLKQLSIPTVLIWLATQGCILSSGGTSNPRKTLYVNCTLSAF